MENLTNNKKVKGDQIEGGKPKITFFSAKDQEMTLNDFMPDLIMSSATKDRK